MRKRQSLADAQALSLKLLLIEAAIQEKRLTYDDIDEINTLVSRMSELKEGKIIVAPLLLRRVRALAVVAHRFRELRAEVKEAAK